MFKALTRFTSSFAALLTDQNSIADVDARMEGIREAMLNALIDLGPGQLLNARPTGAAIACATEVQTLWYLRSDVLRLLAHRWGEPAARSVMDELTEMFRGIVPKNQMPSPRRLVH